MLESTAGTKTLLSKPGVYKPALLTVTDQNLFVYAPAGPPGTPTVTFPFRQALYLDGTGVVDAKSVLAARHRPQAGRLRSSRTCPSPPRARTSTASSWPAGVEHLQRQDQPHRQRPQRLQRLRRGHRGDGDGTTVVIDSATIINKGVARAGDRRRGRRQRGRQELLHRDQERRPAGRLRPHHRHRPDAVGALDAEPVGQRPGHQPAGHQHQGQLHQLHIKSQGWGVLSTDGCTTPTLTAINSKSRSPVRTATARTASATPPRTSWAAPSTWPPTPPSAAAASSTTATATRPRWPRSTPAWASA